jgi:hypothetical protein
MPGRSSIDSSVSAEQILDEIARGAVRFDEGEHVIALLAQGEQGGGDRGDPRSREQAGLAPLQLREQQFELPQGRIRAARVEKSVAFTAQETRGFLRACELEFDGLVDRRNERPIVGRHADARRVIDAGVVLHGLTIIEGDAH